MYYVLFPVQQFTKDQWGQGFNTHVWNLESL